MSNTHIKSASFRNHKEIKGSRYVQMKNQNVIDSHLGSGLNGDDTNFEFWLSFETMKHDIRLTFSCQQIDYIIQYVQTSDLYKRYKRNQTNEQTK